MTRFQAEGSPKPVLPLIFLALFFFVAVVYWAALDNGFVDWDDNHYVLDNPLIRSLAPENLYRMLTTLEPIYWQPLTWLSHAIDYRLFGLSASGHHLVSILLHGVNAFLAFLLIYNLVGRVQPDLVGRNAFLLICAWAALLFAVHPLRVESVVWAAERKDLLCALFTFGALLAYLRYVSAETPRPRRRWYASTLLLFLMALMSKPMAVTLPVVLLLLDVYPLNRLAGFSGFLQRVWEKAPHFCMSLAVGVLTLIAQGKEGAVVSVQEFSVAERLVNSLRSTVFYIEKTLWPRPLVPLYPFPELDGKLILEVTTFFLISWFCYVKWREGRRYWGVVWMVYLVTLLPVIGLVQVGGQAAADRFTYLPTFGFYVLLAGGVARLWRLGVERGREVIASVLIGYTAILTVGVASVWTIKQIPIWKHSGVFWEWVVNHYPDKLARAHTNLGVYYAQHGRPDRAIALYERAIEIEKDYSPPYNHLALVYQERGEWDRAEEWFRRALEIKDDVMAENNLGLLFMKKGNYAEAEKWFRRAIATQPGYALAYNNLGLLYQTLGRMEEAEQQYKLAVQHDYDLAPAHANLGNLYKKRNELDRALVEFNLAVFLAPDNADMRNALAEVLMASGYLKNAEQELREVLRRHPGHQRARANLERVLAHLDPPN